MQVGFGMLTSCVKVTATQKSYIIINIFECIQAGGIPITNEVDCPLFTRLYFRIDISVVTVRALSPSTSKLQ